jgi:flagellar hook protein FlgE
MGIFGALTTSVAGLRANSYALENISGNIANSQTTAFKRIDTSFMDLIPDTGNNAQLAGSVTAGSRSTNTIAGSVTSSSVSTYMAINGDGFFAVQKPGSFADNSPIFTGVNNYTRRGDFSLDKNGYLVNGAGYYLEGVKIDPTTGNPAGSTPQVLKFQNDFLPSQQTTKIDYRANLSSYPLTTKHNTAVPGSELLRPADFAQNPRTLGTAATPYSNTGVTGNTRNNFATTPVPISASTALVSASGTDLEGHQWRHHGDQYYSVLRIPFGGRINGGHNLYQSRWRDGREPADQDRHTERLNDAVNRLRHRRDHAELGRGE